MDDTSYPFGAPFVRDFVENQIIACIEHAYGDSSVHFDEKFVRVMAEAMIEAQDAAQRIYDSLVPRTNMNFTPGPYVWATAAPGTPVEQEVKENWKPNIPPIEQKFVDKEKMWEAIKAI